MSARFRCPVARRIPIARRNTVPPQPRKAARNPVQRVPSGKGHAPLPVHPLHTSKISLPAPANSLTTRTISPPTPAHSVSAWKIPPTPRTRRMSAAKFSPAPGPAWLRTTAGSLPAPANSLSPQPTACHPSQTCEQCPKFRQQHPVAPCSWLKATSFPSSAFLTLNSQQKPLPCPTPRLLQPGATDFATDGYLIASASTPTAPPSCKTPTLCPATKPREPRRHRKSDRGLPSSHRHPGRARTRRRKRPHRPRQPRPQNQRPPHGHPARRRRPLGLHRPRQRPHPQSLPAPAGQAAQRVTTSHLHSNET